MNQMVKGRLYRAATFPFNNLGCLRQTLHCARCQHLAAKILLSGTHWVKEFTISRIPFLICIVNALSC